MALVWLSIRLRWRRAWGRSLAVALLIGGVGGFVLAAAASARRVEGTYHAFIKEIDAPDLVVVPGCERVAAFGCTDVPDDLSGEAMVERVEALDVVEKVRTVTAVLPYLVDANGAPLLATADDPYGCVDDDRSVSLVALVPGDAKAQSMPFRLNGGLPRAGSSGVVLTLATAKRLGIAVGDSVHVAGWCDGGGERFEMDRVIDLTVTGTSVGPLDVEPPGTGLAIELAFIDDSLVDGLIAAGAGAQINTIVWLDRTASPETISEALASYEIVIDLRERSTVFDDALATDARPLWLLAGVGVLGAALLLTPIIGRHVRDTERDTTTVFALGSTRQQIAVQALAHIGLLALIGGLVAAAIAPVISGFMPGGLAETIAPDIPIRFDWVVTVIGVVVLIVSVLAVGALASWRIGIRVGSPAGLRSRHRRIVAGSSHLDPAARSGVLSAVGTPAGPRQTSPWPSFVSLIVAGATCVASLTYLACLTYLKQTPSVVGWNWDAIVAFDEGSTEQLPSILASLDGFEGVERVTLGTFYPPAFLNMVDHELFVWPWSFGTGLDAIGPTMISGRGPAGPDEVAINAVFARATGLDVGDSVPLARPALVSTLAEQIEQSAHESGFTDLELDQPGEGPVVADFEITGIAVLPLQRTQDVAQVSLTLGGMTALVQPSEKEIAVALAWLPVDLPEPLHAVADSVLSNVDVEGRSAYVHLSGDVPSTTSAMLAIPGVEQVIAPTAEQVLTQVVGLNVSHSDRVPVALVYVVSIAAAALLTYLLYTAVRARRFEFAVMRAVGLSSGGVRWSIAAQATATAVIPLVVALPVGVVVGRRAWMSSARDLDIAAVSVIPWFALTVVVAVAIAVANIVVLVPGWTAVRRSSGRDLRAG